MRGRQAMRVGIWLAAGLALAGCAVDRPAETGVASKPRAAVECPGADPAIKRVYWGDFHVHTAYSLDAYGYGTLQTPADAYRFGKGERVMLDVGPVQLERPLDFMAVTDHAEWLDLMFICSGPRSELYPACKDLKAKSTRTTGGEVFRDYVNPTITLDKPAQTQLCAENPQQCLDARDSQWARLQAQANEADEPCRFTAFIGFEWSATPNASHTHRERDPDRHRLHSLSQDEPALGRAGADVPAGGRLRRHRYPAQHEHGRRHQLRYRNRGGERAGVADAL
jgi:hypothetical protein